MLLSLKFKKEHNVHADSKGSWEDISLAIVFGKEIPNQEIVLVWVALFHGIVTFCNLCEFQAFEIFTD